MNRREWLGAATLPILMSGLGSASAQGRGPVQIVVPYAAGGITDTLARLMAESMRKSLGREVLVDNKPGAAALLATRHVQNADPDGNTLLFHNSGLVLLPMLKKDTKYDPVKDFDPVAMTGIGPNFLMVHESVPARTVPEFIAWAKAQPRAIECANSGINSGGHISAMLLEKLAGLRLLHIPYKGSAVVTTALITGEVKMQVSVTTESLNPYIKQGRVRVLAVATTERTRLAPELPTIGETVPGYAIDGWYGILAPANTPLDRREVIAASIKKALDEPLIKERFASLFMEPVYRGPKEFADAVVASAANFKNIVGMLGLTAQ